MSDLEELDKMFGKILEEFPKERRKLVENGGEKLYQRVLRNIDSETEAKSGNLREACEKHIGSGGGYAAVRNNYQKAPHAHLVENGHRLMKGAEKKIGKHGNLVNIKGSGEEIGWVHGKFMYRNAVNELADELAEDAQQTLEKVLKEAGI